MAAKPERAALPEIRLETGSFTPYYQQIIDQVHALVRAGTVQRGDTFYSEGEIATMLGISKMPIRQAFAKLRAEGLLLIERGKKPVVGSGEVLWDFKQLRGFSEEMKRRGLKPSNTVLDLKQIFANPKIAAALQLKESASVYQLKRLYYISGEPVAVVTSYLPAALFPDLQDQNLENASLYRMYEDVYKRRLKWAEEEIGAVSATGDDAAIMETIPGQALLFVTETTYDTRDVPIEFSESLLRADRYKATVKSIRKP